ncbi:MAG TPA: ABC transporter permease [Ktedonobacterales bacterium]|jgi:ABC-2 type transport system permease protein
MSFSRISALALRIIRQFLRDPRTLALVFLAPILVMTILNFVLNNQSTAAALDVVLPGSDQATTIFKSQLDTIFHQQKDTLSVSYRSLADANTRLDNADVNGVLIFPEGFALQVVQGTSSTQSVTLRLDGGRPSQAKIIQNLVSGILQSIQQRSAAPAAFQPGSSSANVKIIQNTEYLPATSQNYTQNDALAPLFVGLFAFFFVFLLTSVSFLRERARGTIERLLISPLSRTELILGYVLGFTTFAVVQSIAILAYVIFVLQVHYAGNLGLIFLITLGLTIGSVNLGIFLSTFARNELQVIQFIPLVLVPQALLGGLFWSVSSLPVVLKQIAYVLPLTWANFGLTDIMLRGKGLDTIWPDLVVLAAFATLMVLLSTFTVRREGA